MCPSKSAEPGISTSGKPIRAVPWQRLAVDILTIMI
jgi:hypothetical protein